ncbi:hypothetical protein [Altericista sp. CCNU0014]|uniref:hypothetical protein n=1 Tax=Altericista sp. CCNU0014 TaxID=3082949 RepID=UPI00384EBFD0
MPSLVPTRKTQPTPNPHRGFVLPVVLGVGLIAILLGVMTIERSNQNRISAIAQKANARSSAAAEYGVAQLQALLNRYSRLATSSPLSAWAAISETELDPCGMTPDDIARIRSYAERDWSNVSTNPKDGQFRLISYEYKPDPKTGTLVVEGRINPDDAVSLARTQLKVDFDITRAPRVGNAPGLWIEQPQAATIDSSVQLLANFRDATCPGDAAHAALVQRLKTQIQPPYAYQSAPGIDFPALLPTVSSASFATLSETLSVDPIDNDSVSLPSPQQSESDLGQPAASDNSAPSSNDTTVSQSQTDSIASTSNRAVIYDVKASDGQSIKLTNSAAVLQVGTGSDTVVLDLEGGLTIAGGGKILLASGSKLVIYARGPVTLAGTEADPAIEQKCPPGTPIGTECPKSAVRTQLYVYPSPDAASPHGVNLSGNATLFLTLVAPASKVTTSAQVQGSIWAKSLEGVGSAIVREDPISLSDLTLIWPLRIAPITAWRRQESS